MTAEAKKNKGEYVFGPSDIEELKRRLESGEDIDKITRSITKKGEESGIHHPRKPISMNLDTHKTTEIKKDLKTIIETAKDDVKKADTREKKSALIKRNRELFKKLDREYNSKLTKLEKLIDSPEACENLQKIGDEEVTKLHGELFSLEGNMSTLHGYDSEHVERAKILRKKFTDCIYES